MNHQDKEWRRLLILCSIVWGKTPDEIEEKIASNSISLSDCLIVKNIVSLVPFFGESVLNYLEKEYISDRQNKIERLNNLRSQLALLGKNCSQELKKEITNKVREISRELNNG